MYLAIVEEPMTEHDVTKTNIAIDELLKKTLDPRHRFLLLAYHRHRYLEIAGRYEEIFAPDMTVEEPLYHVNVASNKIKLVGQDAVKSLYRTWAETNQCIFYAENEQIAVADNYVASKARLYQQVSGVSLTFNKAMSYLPGFLSRPLVAKVLKMRGVKPDENSMYLYSNYVEMIWPYDDRGRLVGENVWEPEPEKAEIIKLDRTDVLTTVQAAEKLNPLISPLPSFDEMVLARKAA
jgi:hypothetical protein